MSAVRMTKTVLRAGVWHAQAARTDGADHPAPTLSAWHDDTELAGPEVAPGQHPGTWDLRLALPPELLSDGVQTVLIRDGETGDTAEAIRILAGSALGEDIRAEVALLRAELDMLKRAFRRHCVETSTD